MTRWIVRHLKIVSFPITKRSEMCRSCCVDFQKTNFKWQTIIEYETEPERIYHNRSMKWSKWIRNNIYTINKWKPIFGNITLIVCLLHTYFGQFFDERFRSIYFNHHPKVFYLKKSLSLATDLLFAKWHHIITSRHIIL